MATIAPRRLAAFVSGAASVLNIAGRSGIQPANSRQYEAVMDAYMDVAIVSDSGSLDEAAPAARGTNQWAGPLSVLLIAGVVISAILSTGFVGLVTLAGLTLITSLAILIGRQHAQSQAWRQIATARRELREWEENLRRRENEAGVSEHTRHKNWDDD